MRELKFRAWDTERMIHPDEDCGEYLEPHGLNATIESLQGEGTILMQYTGLKDKNGKEIYEGDIITNSELSGEVVFHDRWYEVGMHSGKLAWCILDGKKAEYVTIGSCDDEETWEILGNIYETPELLK